MRPRAGLNGVVKVALYRQGVALINNAILRGLRADGWRRALLKLCLYGLYGWWFSGLSQEKQLMSDVNLIKSYQAVAGFTQPLMKSIGWSLLL